MISRKYVKKLFNKISQLRTQGIISAVNDAKCPTRASLEDKNESQPYVIRSGRAIQIVIT